LLPLTAAVVAETVYNFLAAGAAGSFPQEARPLAPPQRQIPAGHISPFKTPMGLVVLLAIQDRVQAVPM
jgi:hypothetical protein